MWRRVVGVHAVRDCVAEQIQEIVIETIANLKLYLRVRVVATVYTR